MQTVEAAIFHPGREHHEHYPDEQLVARGKAARKQVPRSRHAELDLAGRPDPIELLEAQARSRIPELVPLRYGRMMVSPFAFYRGAALIMASDLARTPSSGLRAQLCGDAHALNFGMFGTPERSLVFDVNDFDETLPGPWEWDLKRLATSFEIAGRNNGFSKSDRRAVVADTVRCYHETIAELAAMGILDVWYARLDIESALAEFTRRLTHREQKQIKKAVTSAVHHDSEHALGKLTDVVDGSLRIISAPPLIVPIRELLGDTDSAMFEETFRQLMAEYRRSLPYDRGNLFDQFRFVALARKVVGVGSVGTRCWIALFLGADNDDPLFLQIKEAEASVLERFVGPSEYPDHAQRVVSGQRLMQASSDLLLGWGRSTGIDGAPRDFYIRQLRDWKGRFVVEEMEPKGMSLYGRACGWALARAHARSGDRVEIASYLGTSDRFEQAVTTFASAYADQNERDHEALVRAVRTGRVAAETGDARSA